MADSKHPLSSFEAALCAKPILSDPMELELSPGAVAKWVWRELSQSRIDALRRSGIQYVEQDRRRKERDGEEWRDVDMDLVDMRATELDLREIHAAMRDADNPDREACSLQSLRDRLAPDMQEHLGNLYHLWKVSISPLTMDKDDIEALVEDLKKNEGNRLSLLTQLDLSMLPALVDYMASLLMTSQTESS